jgi:pimeloyl-ACP methyl ester carboxylesterase
VALVFRRVVVSEMGGLSLLGLRPRRGAFPNGMTYARIGDGPKTLLWLSGATKGLMLAMMTRAARQYVADGYSVWLVSGRPDMPTGHTLVDMAQDYATLIKEEFSGRVDLVVGHSTGGMIGFCLAAEHPDRFGHIAIAGAGLWGERSDRANLEPARLLVAGRTREAGEYSVRLLAPGIRIPGAATVLGVLLARASLTEASAEDLLVSAEALHAFDPREVLPRIGVPVLLVAGDKDMWFAREAVEQAAQLIPNCTLRLYPDTNHFGAITSPRFAADAREFIRHDQQAPA